MKILIIGDIHYGEHGNSQKFNNQILDFKRWIVSEFSGKVDAVVQEGDFFDNRNKVDVSTLSYGIQGAKMLQQGFGKENVYVLAGNHDLYYLNRLDVSSLAAIDAYVTVVDEMRSLGSNVLLTPWIASDSHWDTLVDIHKDYEYVIGHFEFSAFKMNENYVMESGRSHKELGYATTIFSGHYHTKQENDNVIYTGTPYPITFSEANQAHGVFTLDTDTGEIEFIEYTGIKVISIPYDQLDRIQDVDVENTRVRLEFPSDLEDESIIGDMLNKLSEMGFEGSKSQYKGKKLEKLLENAVEVIDIEDIDSNIIRAIRDIDVDGINKEMLESLYNKTLEMKNE